MSKAFRLSVTLISFFRFHCFHAFHFLFPCLSSGQIFMWLLFFCYETLMCPVAARFFLMFNTISVYLFIVSLLMENVKRCLTHKEFGTVKLSSCGLNLFWRFCSCCIVYHLTPHTQTCSLLVMLKNVKSKKCYFQIKNPLKTVCLQRNHYSPNDNSCTEHQSGCSFVFFIYLHQLSVSKIQSMVYHTLCVVVTCGPEVL